MTGKRFRIGSLKIKFNSPLLLIYLGLCFAATLVGYLTGGAATRLLFSVYRSSLTDPLLYVRCFTHVLGHSGWEHFAGNASFLLLLGPILEERYGWKRLLQIILAAALVSAAVNLLLFPNTALCGASGVVFAFIVLMSFTDFKEGEIPLTFLLVAAVFIGKEVYAGLAVSDNISNTAHIIGGAVGSFFGFRFRTTSGK